MSMTDPVEGCVETPGMKCLLSGSRDSAENISATARPAVLLTVSDHMLCRALMSELRMRGLDRARAAPMVERIFDKSPAVACGLRYNEQNKKGAWNEEHTSRNTIWEEDLNGASGFSTGRGRHENDLWT